MAPGASPVLDKQSFYRRMKRIYSAWKGGKSSDDATGFAAVDAVVVGLTDDDSVPYRKSAAFHTWLFGHELVDTLIILCEENIHILASQKKLDFLKTLQTPSDENSGVPSVKLYLRNKADGGKEHFSTLIDAIKNSRKGKTIGEFSKDKLNTEAYKEWNKEVAKGAFERTDVGVVFAYVMAPKDDKELIFLRKAAQGTIDLFKKYYWEKIMQAVDEEKTVKHSRLADGIESACKDKRILNGFTEAELTDNSSVVSCYGPIVQSGNKCDFKFSVVSDDEAIRFGVICATFGVRYKDYCTNIARTVMVAPSKSHVDAYNAAYDLEEHVIKNLKPGIRLCDVFESGRKWLEKEKPIFLPNLKKSFGFATGLEFRESSLVINDKTTTMVKKGMTFWVEVALMNLRNNEGKTEAEKSFGIWLGDTVVVAESGPATNLTAGARKKVQQVSVVVEVEKKTEKASEEAGPGAPPLGPPGVLAPPGGGRSRRTAVVDNRLRGEFSNEEKRKKHQEELAAELNKNALSRLARGKGEVAEPRMKKATVAYRNVNNFPTEDEVKQLQIYVDKKTETLILPLFGEPVPFHISIIKSVAQSVEGDYTYLRINFNHPGAAVMAGQEKNLFPHPEAQFLKELTFRSSNTKEPGELAPASSNLTNTFRLVKELQKRYKTKELEEREQEGVIKQDTLQLNPNKNQPRLKDLFIRPPLSQKRISGALEAHLNGFRYTTLRGDKVDILYNNIKHAIFQPSEGEMIILLHFHLKNAVVLQKRKIVDIQFYTEVGEMTTDLGKLYHMHDRDDLASEQAERELRARLSAAFKSFTEKVEGLTKEGFHVDFDTPYRDLAFPGVPFRSTCTLVPTSSCLVNLSEWPPFVITLDEIELVHFERVQFHIKNFDMVFIFKDYAKKPATVTAIPMQLLEHVKQWLDSVDIHFTEGIQSLNWIKIMKTIADDPKEFFNGGGWEFLEPDDTAAEAAAAADEDEEDEEYRGSESEDEGSGSDSDDYSEGSEVEEEEEDGSDASNDELSSGEESGKDWDELEAEAARSDRQKAMEEEQEVSRRPVKRFGGSGGGGGGGGGAKRMRR